jgi:hypothetical protein
MAIAGAADLLPDSQQAAVRPSVPLFVCRDVAGLGHQERHSRVHGACEAAQSKELADSKATAPLHGACGASAGEGVAPCFGGLGAGEAWRASRSPPRDLGAGADVAAQASQEKRGFDAICDAILLDRFRESAARSGAACRKSAA